MSREAEFLEKHGIRNVDDYTAYQYAFALYVSYLVDAMQHAEDISNGLYFDEYEISALYSCMKEAKEVMQSYRKKAGLPYPEFDPAETITLKGCKIAEGKVYGSEEEAIQIAKMWISDFHEWGRNPFCVEVAIYIFFLLGVELNMESLTEKRR